MPDRFPVFEMVLNQRRRVAVVRVHDLRGNRHAGFGEQPTRCQVPGRAGTLPTAAVRAV